MFGRGEDNDNFLIVEEAPPVLDVEKEWMSITGRVELVIFDEEDEIGNVVKKRLQIICLPEDSFKVSAFFRERAERHQAETGPREGHKIPSAEMLEHCANTLMRTCPGETPSSPTPKSALRKKRSVGLSRSVTFDRIDIHEFNITLGDHPSAVSGPPVMLDWDAKSSAASMPLDDYEKRRGERRNRSDLKMSMTTRCGILQTYGNFTAADITKAWEEAMAIRRQRLETLEGGTIKMVCDDIIESASRKMRRATSSITGIIL